jgi:hypothetical protein
MLLKTLVKEIVTKLAKILFLYKSVEKSKHCTLLRRLKFVPYVITVADILHRAVRHDTSHTPLT